MADENFYSKRLSGAKRLLYDECLKNIERGVYVTDFTLPLGAAFVSNEVFKAVMYGNPQFFYLDQTLTTKRAGLRVRLEFGCKYDNIADKKRALDAEISRIASSVRICGSTYDKLCKISAYLGDKIRGSNNDEPRYGDAYGALVLGEARCEGYAKAAKLIMDKVGIRSDIAIGEAVKGGNRFMHAWNIAYVNDRAYGFDFTWNDNGDAGSVPGVCYLFLSDKDMHIEHFPEYDYAPCTDDGQTFWARNNGIVRSRADLADIRFGHAGKTVLAALRFENAQAMRELQGEAVDAALRLAAKLGRYSGVQYSVNDNLNVLTIYPTAK